MRVWQKYLPQIAALHSRARTLEDALDVMGTAANRHKLSPNQISSKLELAKEIQGIYTRAHRLCALVRGVEDYGMPVKSLDHLQKSIESGLRHMKDVITFLNKRLDIWGLKEPEAEPEVELDAAEADDFAIDEDSLKDEVRHSLKALSNIVEYMEKPTLLKIKKELNRLVNY